MLRPRLHSEARSATAEALRIHLVALLMAVLPLPMLLSGCSVSDPAPNAAAPVPAPLPVQAPTPTPTPTPSPSPPPSPGSTPTIYALDVKVDGSGRVTSDPSGVDCGSNCSATYVDGTTVVLKATPSNGNLFIGWNGDCTGAANCSLTMDRARSVSARFALPSAPVGQWLGGDMHVHDDHSSDGSLPRQTIGQDSIGNNGVSDQIGEAEREGLAWLPLTDHRSYDQHYDPLWESAKLILIPGEEANGAPHCTVHGAVDMIDQGDSPAGSPGFRSVQQSIWSAHSQDATWVVAHPDDGELQADGTPNDNANAVGMDSMEAWNRGSNIEAEIRYAENRWNHGFRFGINGGSDDHFRELWGVSSPGTPRTHVFATNMSERAILQAQRAGRTMIQLRTTDPFVTLEADFQGDGIYEALQGDEVIVPAGTPGHLRVHVTNGIGTTLMLYQMPGSSQAPLQSWNVLQIDETHTVDVTAPDQATWYRVEVRGFGEPAYIDTNAVKSGDIALILAQQSQLIGNQLKAIASPIFVSPALVEAEAEVALPADAGTNDGAVLVLGETAQFNGFPAVAESAFGTHVVAERHTASATEVLYRRVQPDGSAAEAVIISGGSTRARFPKVAASGANVWVVWEDERSGQAPRRKAIYLRQSIDGGVSWLPEAPLRVVDGRAEHPVVAALPSGRPVVAWQEIKPGQPFDIWVWTPGRDLAPINLSGLDKIFGAPTPLDTRSARYPASIWPALAVAADGRVALAWQDNRGDPDPLFTGHQGAAKGTAPDDWQIFVSTHSDSGSWSSPASLGAADRADRHPAVSFARDGSLTVAWDSKPLSAAGPNLSVMAARAADFGPAFATHFGSPALVGGSASAFAQRPALSEGRDGRVRVAWFDNRSDDWRWRIALASQASDGRFGNLTLVPSRGINTWPSLAGDRLVFASTRNALRLQRDPTQQIMLLDLQGR